MKYKDFYPSNAYFSAVFIRLCNPEKCTLASCVFDSEAITSVFKLNRLFALLMWGSWATRLSLPRNLADQHCKILPQNALMCRSMLDLKVCQCYYECTVRKLLLKKQ